MVPHPLECLSMIKYIYSETHVERVIYDARGKVIDRYRFKRGPGDDAPKSVLTVVRP